MNLPGYPANPRRFEVRPGIAMSYLDEGPRDGEIVVMLHGNPSWSYYWRTLVAGLSDRYRCIVPDHVGMGLSDKPDDDKGATPRYDYTLQSRVDDLEALLRHAGVDDATPVTLAVHDWGGMIGFGWALKHAAQVKRLVILNTAAFPMPAAKAMPWQIALGRDYSIGERAALSFAGSRPAIRSSACVLSASGTASIRCIARRGRAGASLGAGCSCVSSAGASPSPPPS